MGWDIPNSALSTTPIISSSPVKWATRQDSDGNHFSSSRKVSDRVPVHTAYKFSPSGCFTPLSLWPAKPHHPHPISSLLSSYFSFNTQSKALFLSGESPYFYLSLLLHLLKQPILVHVGCYHKNIIYGVVHKQRFTSHLVLEAGKSKIEVPADLVSGEAWLAGSYTTFSLCPHTGEWVETFWGLSYKVTDPTHEGSTSCPNYFSFKVPPPPNTMTSGLRIQHINLSGTQTFSP